MTATDQQKVLAAGFTIIRKDDQPFLRIKYKAKGKTEWLTLENNFKSKSARDKRVKEFLKQILIIED